MPRLGSCRTISTNGSEVTTRNGRIKAAGVSASRRCKHSLTPSPLRGKKRSLPDHHQQRTGHLQKGTVCKIKYKLLHFRPRGSTRRRSSTGQLQEAKMRFCFAGAPALQSPSGSKMAALHGLGSSAQVRTKDQKLLSAVEITIYLQPPRELATRAKMLTWWPSEDRHVEFNRHHRAPPPRCQRSEKEDRRANRTLAPELHR